MDDHVSTPQTLFDPVGPTAKKNHQRPASRPKHWYAAAITAAVCVVAIYLGASAYLAPFRWTAGAPISDSNARRTGKIVLQTNPKQCVQMKFDNTSGRFVSGLKPCDEEVTFDKQAQQIPIGTIHRLDAISKSFS